MILFLFKSKYHQKNAWLSPFLCSVFLFLVIFCLEQVSGKCNSDQTCSNGVCKNETCICNEGWQGPECQYCGGKIRLVEPQGFIHDGPGNYSIGVKCSWLIDAGGANTTVRLHIEEFATECGWDHLYVYDGDSVDAPLLAVFSGLMYKDSYAVGSVPEIMTHSGSVLLHFFSDDAYNLSGFNISYAINACPSKYSSQNCSGHGSCDHSMCTCHEGWTGKACDRQTCPGNCSSTSEQGTCQRSAAGTQACVCSQGFGGHDCSQITKNDVWDEVEIQDTRNGTTSHGAVVWRDFLYIVAGESYGRSHLMYTYDFNGRVWKMVHASNLSEAPLARYGGSAVLHEDKIFYYGGVVARHQSPQQRYVATSNFPDLAGHVTSELWAFDIIANSWENITVRSEPCDRTAAMCGPLSSAGHTASVVTVPESPTHRKLVKKMIVIFGHSPQFGYLNTVQEYNFDSREWALVQTRGYPAKGGYGHSAALDQLTDKIYVYGGIVSESESNQVLSSNLYSYDPVTRIWTLLTHAPSARFLHSANFVTAGMMIVFGGNTHNDTSHSFGAKCYSNELLAYDVMCDSWHHLSIPHHLRENAARYGHSGTVYEGKLYIYGGFSGQLRQDLLRMSPGGCHGRLTHAACLTTGSTLKCMWNNIIGFCYDMTEVSRFNFQDWVLHSDHERSYKCPEESRDRITHKDDCSLQWDCASCVQTAYSCVWCPAGVCMSQRCNISTSQSQGKTISSLEKCTAEGGAACSSLHSCRSCLGASASNIVQGANSSFPCHWDLDAAKCTQRTAGSVVHSSSASSVCSASCWEQSTCNDCTQEECIWCQNQARCVDKNAYTASFPYGQCREWTTVTERCRSPRNTAVALTDAHDTADPCVAYDSCSSCLEDPACGWCDDGSRTGLGACMPGGAAHPTAPRSCHNWHFTHCPSCQCNGHSTCADGGTTCLQPCGNLTMGTHCERCSPGNWGNPLKGGRCQPCECNERATLCHPESGKCFCTTKGRAGNRCEKCDSTNHYSEHPKKGICYYDLPIDYQFTFNLSKKEDRHFTQINFRSSPIKPDIDADFRINCSKLAKVNITVLTADGQENIVFHSMNCTNFNYRFAKADHNFGIEDNVPLTTFFVHVYDFQTPLLIMIYFAQHPKLNLQQLFVTLSSWFIWILLLLLALLVVFVVWKVIQKCDMHRQRKYSVVEMNQMVEAIVYGNHRGWFIWILLLLLALLVVFVVWKVIQKCDMHRQRKYSVVEMNQMASSPLQVIEEVEIREGQEADSPPEVGESPTAAVTPPANRK